jgi:hypothetical protein
MKFLNSKKTAEFKFWLSISFLLAAGLLSSCSSIDPRETDAELTETLPYMKETSYTQALNDLGLMTEIYGSPSLKIQCNPMGDNTGTSASTGGEIPRDITEIMKSSLNAIGGKVIFIPYDPSFIQNNVVTGYSTFSNKTIPDVVLSGGITEFDRGLETRGESTDASMGGEIKGGLPADIPGKDLELRYGAASKSGLARITLDFNLLDYVSMTGIPKMNITNSMEVHKASSDKEMGVSIFGQTFGAKGSVKKVQGRHAAVRLLVELSMIQMVGKHLSLPYWRFLGEGATPDKYVLDRIGDYYRILTDEETIANVQEWLYLYGYNVEVTARMDVATKKALAAMQKPIPTDKKRIGFDTFLELYLHVPVSQEVKRRRDSETWRR